MDQLFIPHPLGVPVVRAYRTISLWGRAILAPPSSHIPEILDPPLGAPTL